MLDRGPHLVFRGTVAGQLVRDHDTRGPHLPLQQLAKQALGGPLVPPALDENVEHEAILVDGPPEPVLLSADPRYTTLLRAIELWGAVQADGPGRLAGDEEPPPGDGLVVCRKQDLSQQIKADPEDRLSAAFVGLDDDRPVFRLPFASRVGERKGYGQHGEKLADPIGVNEVGILELEAARLGGRKKRFDLPPPPVMGQGALWIRVGSDDKQVSADQPRRSQFERRSKRAVA